MERIKLQPKDLRAINETIVITLAKETPVAWIADTGLVYPKIMWTAVWKKPFKPH